MRAQTMFAIQMYTKSQQHLWAFHWPPHQADGSFWMICLMMKSFWDREENTTRQKPCCVVFSIWCSSFQAFHLLLLKHKKPEQWEILSKRGRTWGRLPSTMNSGNDPSLLNNLCTFMRWPDDAGDAALVQVGERRSEPCEKQSLIMQLWKHTHTRKHGP